MVGGGDTATEEALYLTKYASHVHLLVRGQRLRASGAMQDRVRAHGKVTVHHDTQARPPRAALACRANGNADMRHNTRARAPWSADLDLAVISIGACARVEKRHGR